MGLRSEAPTHGITKMNEPERKELADWRERVRNGERETMEDLLRVPRTQFRRLRGRLLVIVVLALTPLPCAVVNSLTLGR